MAADFPNPLELAQQAWTAWGDAARSAMNGAQQPDWQDPMQWWSRLAGGAGMDATRAADKVGTHAQDFMSMLQSLAGRAGEGLSQGDVAAAFKQMFGQRNPMLDAMRSMGADGARGWEQMTQDWNAALTQLNRDGRSWFGMPTFGYNREQQERLQAIVRAQSEYAEQNAAYNALLAKAGERGMERFQQRLTTTGDGAPKLDSARAIYDLWIDAAEDAYAEVAMSPEFRHVYGAMVNAQMRLKQAVQREFDQQAAQLGLPTRRELDGAYRKIHELQREMRELRDMIARGAKPAAAAPAAEPAPKRAPAKTPKAKAAPAAKTRARTRKEG